MASQTPETDEVLALTPIADAEDRRDRNDEVIRLLDEWLADESGYDEETWPLLKEALNRERELVGAPKLFPE